MSHKTYFKISHVYKWATTDNLNLLRYIQQIGHKLVLYIFLLFQMESIQKPEENTSIDPRFSCGLNVNMRVILLCIDIVLKSFSESIV